MHGGELEIDAGLVRRLLRREQPAWVDLPLRPVPSSGTDNALFRLGEEMVVRLPRIHWAVDAVRVEFEWLPRLAPELPLAVPRPLVLGGPGEGYPWPWAVYEWLDGDDASRGRIGDVSQAARALRPSSERCVRSTPPARPGPKPATAARRCDSAMSRRERRSMRPDCWSMGRR